MHPTGFLRDHGYLPKTGALIVVNGPSGVGKTTIVGTLAKQLPVVTRSVSVTTRPPRLREHADVDYTFVDDDTFAALRAQQLLLEYSGAYGYWYGTVRETVERMSARGDSVMLVVNTAGMRQVRQAWPDVATVFVLPPNIDALRQPLRARGHEHENAIAARMESAQEEMATVNEYDYVIINDHLQTAVKQLQAIIIAELARRHRLPHLFAPIV